VENAFYQWITVTLCFIARTLFSSFVVPDTGMGVRMKGINKDIPEMNPMISQSLKKPPSAFI